MACSCSSAITAEVQHSPQDSGSLGPQAIVKIKCSVPAKRQEMGPAFLLVLASLASL